jgi:predicted AAA+ superfamily ATPase
MIEPTIAKDVLNNHVITKPSLMRRLFELGSSYSSQILSLNKMLGELDDAGNTTTLAGYLNLLSECGMLAGISKYAGSIIRKRNSIPKFQVYNNALRNVYCEFDFRKAKLNPKEWGRIFESAIGAHLINYVEPGGLKLYYWRENNDEVDFILEKFHTTVAIEVKSAADTHNTGLQVFKNKFNPKSAFFVGSSGIPVEDFLSEDPNDLF